MAGMEAGPRPLVWFLGCLAAVAGPSGLAVAQLLPNYFPDGVPGYATDPGVTVQSRARPLYDPVGTRVGNAIVHPLLDESLGYDDNVLGLAHGPGSWIVGTHPSVLATSADPTRPWGVYLGFDNQRYLDTPSQSRTDWVASAGGTISFGEDKLTLAASHLSLHQDATQLDALPTDQPVAYQVEDLHLAYTSSWNRLSVEPNLDFSAWRFASASIGGAAVSQTYRNRDVTQGGVTLRYEMAPLDSAVLVLRGTDQSYLAPSPGGVSSDSLGWAVLAGVDRGGDGVWRARLLAGWEWRDFAAPQYEAHDGPVAEAEAIWSPGGMVTITGLLSHRLEDAAQEGVAGFAFTDAKLTLDYEWRRNVLLQGSAGIERADLLQGGGRQTAATLGLGATWLINRRLSLLGSYQFTDQRGTAIQDQALTGSFVRNIWLLTARLGL
jgi:hypothetical protein